MPLLDMFKRNTFIGRTDQYLSNALAGLAVIDPMRDYFTQHQRDDTITRLNRYYQHWRFYNRKHYLVESREGQRKMVVNYCRPIADKSTDWLFNRGFTIRAPQGNERLAKLLQAIWKDNNAPSLMWRAGQIGAVTGDAYLFLSVPWLGDDGTPIPQAEQQIAVQTINSSYVHPRFVSSVDRRITSVLIQYPVERRRFGAFVPETKDRDLAMYSQYIDAREIREFIDDLELPVRRPNPFGEVTLVHIQNMLHPGFFGVSDLEDILELNAEYNETMESERKIIRYHAEPTTIVFGAKAGELQRGANKVWSGLPVDARVENLVLNANLAEIDAYRESIKLAIHELTNTPESSLGKIQAISNTSDAALQTTYLPLIEKTLRKRITYGEGIAKACALMVRMLENYFGVDVARFVDSPAHRYEFTVEWPSPLPVDRNEVIAIETQKVTNGLQSELGALEAIGEPNVEKKSVEILADKRMKLLSDAEGTKAALGELPNVAVFSTGSLAQQPAVAAAFEAEDAAMDRVARKLAKGKADAAAAAAGQQ